MTDPAGYYEKFKVVRNATGEEITEFRFVRLARRTLRRLEGENPTLAQELRERLA